MDGEIYNRAMRRMSALQAELKRLEAFVTTFQELAEANAAPGSTPASLPQNGKAPHEPSARTGTVERHKATPQGELERVVEEVLIENGAPMRRSELLERVKAKGVVVGGENESANFGSKLSRAGRLVNLSRLGYWPKEKPFEQGGYQPDRGGLAVAA